MSRVVYISIERLGGEDVPFIHRVVRRTNGKWVKGDTKWLLEARGYWYRDGGHYERREVYIAPPGMRISSSSRSREEARRIVLEGKRVTEEVLQECGDTLDRKKLLGCIRWALLRLYDGNTRDAVRCLREGLVECGEKESSL